MGTRCDLLPGVWLWLALVCVSAASACGEDSGSPPRDVAASTSDTAEPADLSSLDAAHVQGDADAAGAPPSDTWTTAWDESVPLPGVGTSVGTTLCLSTFPPTGTSPQALARRAHFYQRLKELGVRVIRHGFHWHHVEKKPGVYTWAANDQRVADAKAHGVELVAMVGYGNTWASKLGQAKDDPYFPPDDPADFAGWASALVKRYGAQIRRWEIWNEPNAGYRFWKGGGEDLNGDPKAYGALYIAAAKAIHAVDPGATVAFGSLFYLPQLIQGAEAFTTAAYASNPGFHAQVDALSYHPYSLYPPVNPPEKANQVAGGIENAVPVDETARRLRKLLASKGGARPLWITELGWPTEAAVTPERTADYLVRAYALALSEGVELLCWYTFMDHAPGTAKVIWEGVFGLHEWDGDLLDGTVPAPKPAAVAHAVLAHTLGPLRFSQRHTPAASDAPSHRLTFVADAGTDPGGQSAPVVHVVWDWQAEAPQERSFPARELRIYTAHDALGQPVAVSVASDRRVHLTVGQRPVYVLER